MHAQKKCHIYDTLFVCSAHTLPPFPFQEARNRHGITLYFALFLCFFALFFGTFCPFRVPFLPLSVPFPSCPCIFCAWSFPFLHFRAWLFFRALRRPLPCLPYCGKFRNMDCHGIARNSTEHARIISASYLHHVRHGSARSCKTRLCSKHGTPACRISKAYNFTSADIAKCIHTTLCKSSFRIHTTERQFNALFCSRISTEAAPLRRLYGQPKIEKYIHTILCILRREKMRHNAYICITQKLRCFPGYEPTQKHRSRRIKGVEIMLPKWHFWHSILTL